MVTVATVVLSERSMELAQRAVASGNAESIEAAVERALQVMTVHDMEFERTAPQWDEALRSAVA